MVIRACGVIVAVHGVVLLTLSGLFGTAQRGKLKLNTPVSEERAAPLNTGTNAPPAEDDLPCGHLPIDDWNEAALVGAVNLEWQGGHRGARFGNQLFTAAVSIALAMNSGKPIIFPPPISKKQIHKLPCIRSSRHIGKLCTGCQEDMIWQDRNQSCGEGAGCLQHLKSTRKIQYIGVGYHQNIREWGKKPAVEWLPIFRQMFWAPVPQEPPAPLPSSTDLVIYFRSFFDRSFFDVWHMQMRVGHMPLAYYRWAAQHHRRVVSQSAKIWLVSAPEYRAHPTLLSIKTELGAELFEAMNDAEIPWLGDFTWVRSASHIVLSCSTFGWWAGFLSYATTIYAGLPPMPIPMPWCELLPDDPRYIFYDVLKEEEFKIFASARKRCLEYQECNTKRDCPAIAQISRLGS